MTASPDTPASPDTEPRTTGASAAGSTTIRPGGTSRPARGTRYAPGPRPTRPARTSEPSDSTQIEHQHHTLSAMRDAVRVLAEGIEALARHSQGPDDDILVASGARTVQEFNDELQRGQSGDVTFEEVQRTAERAARQSQQIEERLREHLGRLDTTVYGEDGQSGLVGDITEIRRVQEEQGQRLTRISDFLEVDEGGTPKIASAVNGLAREIHGDGTDANPGLKSRVKSLEESVFDANGQHVFVHRDEVVTIVRQHADGGSFKWGLFAGAVVGGALLGFLIGLLFGAWGLGLMVGGAIGAIIGMLIAGRSQSSRKKKRTSKSAPSSENDENDEHRSTHS